MYRVNILLILTIYYGARGADIIEDSFYGKLNVPLDVKDAKLSRAFRKVGGPIHPDRNRSPGATERFQIINNVYQTLKDPEQRNKYDASLAIELLQSNSAFAQVIACQMQEEEENSLATFGKLLFFIFPCSLCCTKNSEYFDEENA